MDTWRGWMMQGWWRRCGKRRWVDVDRDVDLSFELMEERHTCGGSESACIGEAWVGSGCEWTGSNAALMSLLARGVSFRNWMFMGGGVDDAEGVKYLSQSGPAADTWFWTPLMTQSVCCGVTDRTLLRRRAKMIECECMRRVWGMPCSRPPPFCGISA